MKQSEIQIAYDEIRPQLISGCLFLTSKNAMVSKIIRWTDSTKTSKASMSHVGMLLVKEYNGEKRVMVIDSNSKGVKLDFFSTRLKSIDNFIIIKPTINRTDVIEKSVFDSIDRATKGIKYDLLNGLKEMWNRKGRWFKFSIKLNPKKDICSDYVSQHAMDCKMVVKQFKYLRIAFPEDYLRHWNPNYAEIIKAKNYV